MECWLLGKKPCLLSDYSPQQVTEDQRAPCAEISTLFTITKSTTNPGVVWRGGGVQNKLTEIACELKHITSGCGQCDTFTE